MTESGIPKYYCKNCGFSLSQNQKGPCPKCGKTEKVIKMLLIENLGFTDSLSRKFRREFFEENPLIKWFLLILSFGSPFFGYFIEGYMGLIIGLFISIISWLLGPYSIIKVIKEESYEARTGD